MKIEAAYKVSALNWDQYKVIVTQIKNAEELKGLVKGVRHVEYWATLRYLPF